MPMFAPPDWNVLLNKPSVVNSINGNTGAVTAAQVSAAATAGYGYTPPNPANVASTDIGGLNVGAFTLVNYNGSNIAIGGTFSGHYTANWNGSGFSNYSLMPGTWRAMGYIGGGNVAIAQRIA